MKKKLLSMTLVAMLGVSLLAGCNNNNGGGDNAGGDAATESSADTEDSNDGPTAQAGDSATGKTDLADANFDTSYEPKQKEYKIYCQYKLVHSWYDAIRAGVIAAVEDLASRGITVDYEWYAPVEPDSVAEVNNIETQAGQGWDMLAIDINQAATAASAIDGVTADGARVCIFGGADADCNREFFVGNTDNYGDGAKLAKEVCEQMGGKGQIALLAGTIGAESHEQRLQAFKDVIAEYPDIEIVDEQRDNDSVESAISITEAWLATYPDLGGILANNMSNPVGAAQAVKDAGKSGEIIIGGMDHDLRTLEYLQDGTIYVAQIQNCFDMGYKMVYYAIQAIDGETVPDSTSVGSTSAYKDDAQKFIDMLYE